MVSFELRAGEEGVLRGDKEMAFATECPVCGKIHIIDDYEELECSCGYDFLRCQTLLEVLRKHNVSFEDILRLIVHLYNFEVFKETKLGELVKIAKEILLEEGGSGSHG